MRLYFDFNSYDYLINIFNNISSFSSRHLIFTKFKIKKYKNKNQPKLKKDVNNEIKYPYFYKKKYYKNDLKKKNNYRIKND